MQANGSIISLGGEMSINLTLLLQLVEESMKVFMLM